MSRATPALSVSYISSTTRRRKLRRQPGDFIGGKGKREQPSQGVLNGKSGLGDVLSHTAERERGFGNECFDIRGRRHLLSAVQEDNPSMRELLSNLTH
jgi:hypothetical protein